MAYTKIKRYPSGKRVRVIYDDAGNVKETLPLRRKQTRTYRKLARARRRIGLR